MWHKVHYDTQLDGIQQRNVGTRGLLASDVRPQRPRLRATKKRAVHGSYPHLLSYVILGRMRRPQSHVVGDMAETQVSGALQTVGCSVGKNAPDYGEDLFVEIPTEGELRGVRVLLQVKGTKQPAKIRKGWVTLGRVATSLLEKWAGTLLPCAFVRWNVNRSSGHYAFTNTPNNFICSFRSGQESKTLSAPETQVLSSNSSHAFVRDAVLAHRSQEDLIRAVEDPSGWRQKLDEGDVQRVLDILVSTELLEGCRGADGTVGYLLSRSAKEAVSQEAAELSLAHADWYAEDLIRQAWVFTIRRRLCVGPGMEPRLVLSCLRVLGPFAAVRESVRTFHQEFGHPLKPDSGGE